MTDVSQKFVPVLLRDAAKLYEERNVMYGDNYKRFGPIMNLLFPDGVKLNNDDDHNRFGIFVQIVSKVTRYANQFDNGGHPDSLDDTIVYAAMLQELDATVKGTVRKPETASGAVQQPAGVVVPATATSALQAAAEQVVKGAQDVAAASSSLSSSAADLVDAVDGPAVDMDTSIDDMPSAAPPEVLTLAEQPADDTPQK